MLSAGFLCRLTLVASLAGAAVSAQILSGGVRGGGMWGPNAFENFTVGPTVEFKPPVIPIRVVADALYKRVGVISTQGQGTLGTSGTSNTVSVWDFPIMARVELPFPVLKPFVGAGPTFRRISLFDGDWQKGGVVGAGIRFDAFAIKITPEFRYSHFGPSSARGHDNQGEFLIGLTF